MILPVHIRQLAQADIEEAARWYELRSEGLGQRFLDEVERTLARLAANPLLYPKLHRQIRRALLRRFPLGIFYLAERDRIVVVAIMHARQRPRRWQERG